MKDAKAIYRALCDTEASIPLFSSAWWLDAAAGNSNWDVALVEKNGAVIAAMPYVMRKRLGFKLLTQPPLTQTLGPWLRIDTTKSATRLSRQKEMMDALIARLPPFDHYIQRWHYSNTNWLPFYWSGFEQTTRYTYVIEDLSDLDVVLSGFSPSKRRNIRKAEKIVDVAFDIPAELFYNNHKMILSQQNAKISYAFDVFKRMYDRGYERKQACTIAAYGKDRILHAALFLVWDQNSAYNLISTIDHRYRNSGAASLLFREALKHVSTKAKRFDFEGSMIQPVERSYRQFNTVQVPYFSVSKTPSKLYALGKFVKSLRPAR